MHDYVKWSCEETDSHIQKLFIVDRSAQRRRALTTFERDGEVESALMSARDDQTAIETYLLVRDFCLVCSSVIQPLEHIHLPARVSVSLS